jgi:hypothetical protein
MTSTTPTFDPARRREPDAQLAAIIQPLETARYEVDIDFSYVEHALAGYAKDFGMNLAPDFQRGHVWTRPQQEHFVENVLRRVVSSSGLVVQFNCPHWDEHDYAGDLPREMQIIDGLQRLTAVRRFIGGEIHAFGMSIGEFANSSFDAARRHLYRLRFAVHTFSNRRALLNHYLALNAGGTPHAHEEIERVRGLLAQA